MSIEWGCIERGEGISSGYIEREWGLPAPYGSAPAAPETLNKASLSRFAFSNTVSSRVLFANCRDCSKNNICNSVCSCFMLLNSTIWSSNFCLFFVNSKISSRCLSICLRNPKFSPMMERVVEWGKDGGGVRERRWWSEEVRVVKWGRNGGGDNGERVVEWGREGGEVNGERVAFRVRVILAMVVYW